jgi:hypothetical protein
LLTTWAHLIHGDANGLRTKRFTRAAHKAAKAASHPT